MGGVRITAPAALQLGDAVELTVDEGAGPFTLSGLVVSTSADGVEARYGHIAFTRLTPLVLISAIREPLGPRCRGGRQDRLRAARAGLEPHHT
ncbi:MAG: PilZ domain-containing protein [Actinobacteria bacterium]|nr:PilZ domain-containing protein [Actinomycetota bacterium]